MTQADRIGRFLLAVLEWELQRIATEEKNEVKVAKPHETEPLVA